MENIDSNVQVDDSFINNIEIRSYLNETAKWGKFLAIVGYIGMGILILVAIFMMSGLFKVGQYPQSSFPIGMVGFIYIILN